MRRGGGCFSDRTASFLFSPPDFEKRRILRFWFNLSQNERGTGHCGALSYPSSDSKCL
jgi:hypothetical protein